MGQTGFHNALKIGHQIHWYTIDQVLGQGGFGITYLAHDNNLAQPVAIKEFLPTEFAVRGEDHSINPITQNQSDMYHWALDRFITEARTLAKFDHPNIVRVMAVFEANNAAYIVMRYEEGETLEHLFKIRGTLPEKELLNIFLPIIDGLEIVHKAGFIHRDIKPANIFIREDNSPVLIDFGSARQAVGAQTQTLTTLISPGYSPIEQYYSKGEDQGPWTDIYGLASTIYRGMAGKRPVDTMTRSKHILAEQPDPYIPAVLVGEGRYSTTFLQAIDHGMEFRHQHRPQDLSAWKRLLTRDPSVEEQIAIAPDEATIQAPGITELAQPTQVVGDTTEIGTPEDQPISKTKTWKEKWFWLVSAIVVILGFVVLNPFGAKKPAPEPGTDIQSQSPATDDRSTKLNQLLVQAEKDVQADRLTIPRGRNAFERYREALIIDPDNQIAKDGMRKIIKRKMSIIEKFIKKNELDKAETHIDHLLELIPNNQKLLQLRSLIRNARNRQ
ncbi:MAG: serine/threonine protein kinase [Gammaproteobacteria bacterium]|nr:MAG: serine/threonine protein kinase [Gammaproteobacteria bacterium]